MGVVGRPYTKMGAQGCYLTALCVKKGRDRLNWGWESYRRFLTRLLLLYGWTWMR